MDGQTREVLPAEFALPCVKSEPQFDRELSGCLANRLCAANRPSRPVERGNKAVASRDDLASAEPAELVAHRVIMEIEQGSPPLVA